MCVKTWVCVCVSSSLFVSSILQIVCPYVEIDFAPEVSNWSYLCPRSFKLDLPRPQKSRIGLTSSPKVSNWTHLCPKTLKSDLPLPQNSQIGLTFAPKVFLSSPFHAKGEIFEPHWRRFWSSYHPMIVTTVVVFECQIKIFSRSISHLQCKC